MTYKRTKNKSIRRVQSLERKVSKFTANFVSCQILLKNRKAVSPVISNLILISAVIAIGLVALSYARSTSNDYQTQYSETVYSDISKLKESITFEFASYQTGEINIYFLNTGQINVELKGVTVDGIALSTFTLHSMEDDSEIQNQIVESGHAAYLTSSFSSLTSGTHTIKLTTGSGSVFVYSSVV